MKRLGLVSAILPDLTAEEVIAYAAGCGFSSVELMCWPHGPAERRYAGVTHLDVDHMDASSLRSIRAMLDHHNMHISGLGYYPNPMDPNPERSAFHVEHIKKIIRAADTLGVPVVNTFVGRDWTKDIQYNLDRFREIWPGIVQFAIEHNVRIGIENCPMFFTRDEWPGGKNLATTPAIWDRMFAIIPSNHFGLNYDPSHMVWQMMDPLLPVREYADRFVHVHLKDVKIHREKLDRVGIMACPLEYHSPRIPGRGEIDWPAFFLALKESGYTGDCSLEVEDKDYEGSPERVREAIMSAFRFLHPLMNEV
jgi:sugar phosphate isomerase/epimerase